jgi:hypothetical protein
MPRKRKGSPLMPLRVDKKSRFDVSECRKGENPNQALIDAFLELSAYEGKAGNTFQSRADKRVATTLQSLKSDFSPGTKVRNIGTGSVEKIEEFLKTGKIEKLQKFKEEFGDLPAEVEPGVSDAKPLTAEQKKAWQEAKKALAGETVASLKEQLRLNDQKISGKKAELVQRVAFGKAFGALPICPACQVGKLQFDAKTGIYICPGYRDDDQFVACGFASGHVELSPWKTP